MLAFYINQEFSEVFFQFLFTAGIWFVHSNVIICNIHLHSPYRNMEQFCIFSIIADNFSNAIKKMSLFFLLLVFLNFLLALNPKENPVSFLQSSL